MDLALAPYFEHANLIMVYLLGVMWAAFWLGRGPAILASLLSVLLFDFLFVPPRFTLGISDSQYLLTFGVMLAAAILISTLGARLKGQVRAARLDARRSRLLASLSSELVAIPDRDRILTVSLRHLERTFESRAVVLLPDAGGRLSMAAGDPSLFQGGGGEQGVAQWAFDSGQLSGLGTTVLPESGCLHLPLRGSRGELGILSIQPPDIRQLMAPDAFRLLQAFANQTALALERARLADEAEGARVQSETDRLRNALLSSVSHDLRTPLAVITGVTSTLLDGDSIAPAERREMLKTAADEAARLNRLVVNLLAMTRLEAGALEIKRSWHSLEELIGAALHRLGPALSGRTVHVDTPRDLPLVNVDDVLIEQVFFNLLENALKHAPSPAPIDVRARASAGQVEVSVRDRGPGIAPGTEKQVFEKFYREAGAERSGGVGLGLAICRGIIEAHGGQIRAAQAPGGGVIFSFTLPVGGELPQIEVETLAPGEEAS